IPLLALPPKLLSHLAQGLAKRIMRKLLQRLRVLHVAGQMTGRAGTQVLRKKLIQMAFEPGLVDRRRAYAHWSAYQHNRQGPPEDRFHPTPFAKLEASYCSIPPGNDGVDAMTVISSSAGPLSLLRPSTVDRVLSKVSTSSAPFSEA